MKFLMSLASFWILVTLAGCGSAPEANSNAANVNVNVSNSRMLIIPLREFPPQTQ
jgi:hypothetical protein